MNMSLLIKDSVFPQFSLIFFTKFDSQGILAFSKNNKSTLQICKFEDN